jgi:hypothetical protein
MTRRKPVVAARPGGRANRSAAQCLSADDLDELLSQAGVPQDKRAYCADLINQNFERYRGGLRLNATTWNEASQAESLRRTADAARELYKSLASLPPALRWDVEPDYRAFIERVRKAQAAERAFAAAYDVPTAELAKRDPDPEAERVEDVSMPKIAYTAVNRRRRRQLPLPVQLPLEHILAALIETTEKRRLEIEAQVSRGSSKSRRTFARNQLALQLKAIIMGLSPEFDGNERSAEDWAVLVLDAAEIRCPYRATNPSAFKRMFAR